MNKKNVLFFVSHNRNISFFTEEGKSGFWGDLLTCYNDLFSLTIIVPNEQFKSFQIIQNLYGIENLNGFGIPWVRKSKRFPSLGLARVIKNFIYDREFDFVVCQNSVPFGLTAKALSIHFKAELIIHEHTAFRTQKKEITKSGISNWFHLLRALSMLFANKIITPSEFLKDDIIATLKVKKEIHVVPNPLFLSTELKDMKSKRYKENAISVANWHLNKNLKLLIDAINNVNKTIDLKLDVIGYMTNDVKDTLKDIDLKNVNFIGPKPHSYVLNKIKSSRVFILPSKYETFSLPTIEAMILKTEVISTRCGAPEYLLDENRGVLCDEDSISIARCIINLLQNNQPIDVENASKWAKDYVGRDNVVCHLQKVFLK